MHWYKRFERQCGVEVIEQIEVQPVAAKQHISFTQLWSGPFARRSLMLWLIWFRYCLFLLWHFHLVT